MRENILITGVGGGVGQSIIKSLQDSSYNIIGVDGEFLGTGLYVVSKGYKVSYAVDPAYIPRILEICLSENCKLIFPGMDAELTQLSQHAGIFKRHGIIPVVSSPEVISICDDKLATNQFLSNHGFYAPRTVQLSQDMINDLQFPIVLKPQKEGARSQGVCIVSNQQELSLKLPVLNCKNYVAQEYIQGDEYTCGTVNFDGHCYGSIVMRRILRDGDTYKAFVVSEPQIQDYVRQVAKTLQPFGACNFQLKLKNGDPYIFEINARCSGTTYARALAGFNEPLMITDFLLRAKTPTYEIKNISILRYWKELIVDNKRIKTFEETGHIIGDGSKL